MRFVRARFVVTLFFSSLLAMLVGGAASLFFLPWVYSAEVQDGESLVVISAPRGGIVRSLRAVKGEQVRADTIVAEILVTDIQPPDALVAREILYKRAENARYESQRGGLKQILLKPDLRARLAVDRDYASFVAEQRRLFRSFQTKLTKATKSLQTERSRLDVQVRGMEGEIASLLVRQALLDRELGEAGGGAELRSESKRNRRSIRRHRKQLRDLRGKVLSNAKASLKVTLRVRREQSVGMEEVRAELNALYARMGLPSNAFDRIGLVEASGGQRLRRLIARKSGRVVRVAEDVRPGDVVVGGRVLVEILPNGRRSSYRLRLEDGGGVLTRAVGRGEMRVRSLRCENFPKPLVWQGESREGVLLLEQSLLRAEDFPSVQEGGRCSVVAGLEGAGGGFVLGVVREVFAGGLDGSGLREGMEGMWELTRGVGEGLWVRLDFLRGEDRIEKTGVILQNFVDDIKSAKINNTIFLY